MKVIICDVEFKSKKDLETFTRHLLQHIRKNLDDAFEIKGAEFAFMNELFKRHPDYLDKVGCGIKKI